MNLQQRLLAIQILRLCEKQYRKGYQHGVTHALDGQASNESASAFRLSGEEKGYRMNESPFKLDVQKAGRTAYAERMLGECQMPNMDELVSLLSEYVERSGEPAWYIAKGKDWEPASN